MIPVENDFYTINLKMCDAVKSLYKDIAMMETTKKETALVGSLTLLLENAKRYDVQNALNKLSGDYMGKVPRNFENPQVYIDPSIIGQAEADIWDKPLPQGQEWNRGIRIMNDGQEIPTDANNNPIFPIMNFGINGQGVLWRKGANHAVDMGPVRVMKNKHGKETLHVLGIVRKDDKKKALCGGFTMFTENADGSLAYDRHAFVYSQTIEFFEEMVSGSVQLLPEYAQYLDADVQQKIDALEQARKVPVSTEEREKIREQRKTHYKLQQVLDLDKGFIGRLYQVFDKAIPCFSGALLSSDRNCNGAWMETRLSWFELDKATWEWIKGDNKFNYELCAGDDAAAVMWHEITPETLAGATGGHAALMGYLLTSYIANNVTAGNEVGLDIYHQAGEVLDFFTNSLLQAMPKPKFPSCG